MKQETKTIIMKHCDNMVQIHNMALWDNEIINTVISILKVKDYHLMIL